MGGLQSCVVYDNGFVYEVGIALTLPRFCTSATLFDMFTGIILLSPFIAIDFRRYHVDECNVGRARFEIYQRSLQARHGITVIPGSSRIPVVNVPRAQR